MSVDERGMVPRDEWQKTAVHKASTYFCGKCGKQFAMPQDVYDHMDAEHPTKDGWKSCTS